MATAVSSFINSRFYCFEESTTEDTASTTSLSTTTPEMTNPTTRETGKFGVIVWMLIRLKTSSKKAWRKAIVSNPVVGHLFRNSC